MSRDGDSRKRGCVDGDGGCISCARGNTLCGGGIGVYLHGLAGEYAEEEKTAYGMIASDITHYLPDAFRIIQYEAETQFRKPVVRKTWSGAEQLPKMFDGCL